MVEAQCPHASELRLAPDTRARARLDHHVLAQLARRRALHSRSGAPGSAAVAPPAPRTPGGRSWKHSQLSVLRMAARNVSDPPARMAHQTGILGAEIRQT